MPFLRYDPNRGLETGAPLPDGTTTFFPFSIGPRSCAGQFYSELFVQGAVAIALQDHEFEAKGPVPPPAMVAFCQPMAPAYARVTAPPSVGKKQQPQVTGTKLSVLKAP